MMKILKKILAAILALAAIAVVVLGVNMARTAMSAEPVLIEPPEEAEYQVTAMMDTLCAGKIDEISQYIWGNPDLGVSRDPADEAGALIWEAYLGSLSYELVGDCFITESGMGQKVRLTCLDISTVTSVLRDRSQALLEKRVAEAEETSEIYDENYEYREDFVMAVLRDAVADALAEDAKEKTVELTLNLSYQNEQWWILCDEALVNAVSGGILN